MRSDLLSLRPLHMLGRYAQVNKTNGKRLENHTA